MRDSEVSRKNQERELIEQKTKDWLAAGNKINHVEITERVGVRTPKTRQQREATENGRNQRARSAFT